ncbi:hypothetical protein Scep_025773 [Stephania cephalantha]|uniref:Carotenoid cleavage dioxygenase 4 n=1 Tax=Stephania cephalantha TaxID=152367 RepID=A0AAP0HPN6_9MAGN
MEAFSSSLFSPICPSRLILRVTPIPSPRPSYRNNISAVRIQEKPTTTTSTSSNTLGRPESKSTTTTAPPPPQKSTTNTPRRPTTSSSSSSLQTVIFNALDDLIDNFIDPPTTPSVDPTSVLSDNFAPVEEMPPTECPVAEGTLPACLEGGAYIRNGPNPQYLPRGPFHLFDGDGMLHCLSIPQGRPPTFCSRYVQTYKYTLERQVGSRVFPNVFSGFNGLPAVLARGALSAARFLSGQFDPISNGVGLANTSLAFLPNVNMLFALGEADLPYAVRVTSDGDIRTIGRHDFDGKLSMSMTAHPKIDAQTNEVFAFRYGPVPPFLTYFHIDANSSKQPDVPIFSLTTPTFIHDFAITKKYAVFADIQIVINTNPMEMVLGSGSFVGSDPKKVSRIGVIPRYATDEKEMRWVEVPGFNMVHAINAWDEGEDEIVMIAPNIISVEHTLERMELVHASVEKVRVNLKTGTVQRYPISARNLDFGVINPRFVGRKNRFGYLGVGDPMPKISGVVKLDWSEGEHKDRIVGCRMFGEGCYGGEPYFVGKSESDLDEDEDDGYVVSYVHDENVGESKFLVMDAKSPSLEVVAAVKLPRRVPYGFHGLFVQDRDLKKLL